MPGYGAVQAGELEVLEGHLYGGLRVEQYYLTRLGNYGYTSVRAGYVVHPWPSCSGCDSSRRGYVTVMSTIYG